MGLIQSIEPGLMVRVIERRKHTGVCKNRSELHVVAHQTTEAAVMGSNPAALSGQDRQGAVCCIM